ncbi:MAG: helix-turn-helix transcriptional regulator [Clostridiales bacterium]|nr:helix-turn-helix transcriptional regulator [Clostridiales bacterium]
MEIKEENKLFMKCLGKRLHIFRTSRHLSREDAARHIGVSARTIAAYERGEREITIDKIIGLAELYNTVTTKLMDSEAIIEETGIKM